MTERASEIIDMLTIIRENSDSGNSQAVRDLTIIKDCKKESFDFVLDQVIDYIYDHEVNK